MKQIIENMAAALYETEDFIIDEVRVTGKEIDVWGTALDGEQKHFILTVEED